MPVACCGDIHRDLLAKLVRRLEASLWTDRGEQRDVDVCVRTKALEGF
jgi:hypothetical protein